jgi:Icc-related predicted phosphoesterase
MPVLWTACALAVVGFGTVAWVQPAHSNRLPSASNGGPRTISVDPDKAWSVLLISDVQGGFGYIGEIFRRAAPLQPKAVFISGDLSFAPDTADLGLLVRELERHPSPAPLFTVPGNHDVNTPEVYSAFDQWFGGTDFDVTIGPTRFLGADDAMGSVPPEGLQRLSEKLADAAVRQQRVVLVVHRPPVATALCGKDIPGLADLVRHWHPAVVLSGHCHVPSVETRNGTLFVVAPESGDTGTDERRQVVSYLILRWNGESFAVEPVAFERSVWTDLEGLVLHVVLRYVRPHLAISQEVLRALSVALLVGALGTAWIQRRWDLHQPLR